ncbi:NAD-dependent epimerase/dehydratase [Dillenia turbinata]|uniref:NAD-dependent epimerase/dehydratase n=1 Tax=Dillenia turbinata TaxID=194707 RepID=A0AAN8VVS3_9MAGN
MEDSGRKLKYCVTGATGYLGSWLVKSLLHRGYKVHATARNPAKLLKVLQLRGDSDGLQVFRADLREEGSFDVAVEGCDGVLHVAASMEFSIPEKENIESYVESNIIAPATKGTLNILKACAKVKSVKRVVFTSSISTMTAKDSKGNWRPIVDESCQTSIPHVWKAKASGWVYVLSKLLTEEAAFQFAEENAIDLVSVVTTTVAGPFLTANVPSSIRVLLSPITDDPDFFPILRAVNSRMGSISLVHIEDICNAHIFLMEHPNAQGKYICSAGSLLMSELSECLAQAYPFSKKSRVLEEKYGSIPSEISSKKLKDLGFAYKYGLVDIVHRTVSSCIDFGFLPRIGN